MGKFVNACSLAIVNLHFLHIVLICQIKFVRAELEKQ